VFNKILIFMAFFALNATSSHSFAQATTETNIDWPALVTRFEAATASIMITRKADQNDNEKNLFGPASSPQHSGGSGFFIDGHSGILVTADYVISQSIDQKFNDSQPTILVRLSNQETRKASLIGIDSTTAIALLKVENPPKATLKLCDAPAQKAEEVVLMGSAYDQGPLAFRGQKAGLMSWPSVANEAFEAYNLSIHQGTAGAPLLKSSGCVAGVAYGRYGLSQNYSNGNIGLAIGTTALYPIINSLVAKGFVERPYLGVVLDCFGQNQCLNGVSIVNVDKDSPADKGGLKSGDRLLAIDGQDIKSVRHVTQLIAAKKSGDQVLIKIDRPHKKQGLNQIVLTITIGLSPSES